MLKVTLRCAYSGQPLPGCSLLFTRPGLFRGWVTPVKTGADGVALLATLPGCGVLFADGIPCFDGFLPQDAVFYVPRGPAEQQVRKGDGAQVPEQVEKQGRQPLPETVPLRA